MKLTNEDIAENRIPQCMSKKYGHIVSEFIIGAIFARDFYENQNCGTCKHHAEDKTCLELDVMVENDFGCREWETKK